jgi:hypothetical protein
VGQHRGRRRKPRVQLLAGGWRIPDQFLLIKRRSSHQSVRIINRPFAMSNSFLRSHKWKQKASAEEENPYASNGTASGNHAYPPWHF